MIPILRITVLSVLLLLFTAVSFNASAQSRAKGEDPRGSMIKGTLSLLADSLKERIITARDNTEKLSCLQMLCRRSSVMPVDTLKKYATQSLQLAMQLGNESKIREAEYIYAFSLQQRSFEDSALLICDKLIKSIDGRGKDFSLYHDILCLKALCLKAKSQIREAMALAYQMLASAEKYNDTGGQINAYNLLTVVAGQLNGFDDPNANDVYLRKCITWYLKAISLFKDSSYYRKYDRILANLGMTYFQLPKSKNDSALYYINLADIYAREQGQLRILVACAAARGNIFSTMGKTDSAIYYYKQEVALEQLIGDPVRIAMSYSTLRNIYRLQKDYKQALKYDLLERDYCIANHVPIDIVQYQDLAYDYRDLGDYKAYGDMLDTLISVKDSLYQANSAAALAELQTKYEVAKKENTIIQQEYNIARKRAIIYAVLGLLLLVIVTGYMVLKIRRQQQQQRIKDILLENETRTRAEIDNAKEEERKRIISDLHDDVGGGLSTIRMVSDLIARQHEQTAQLNQYALKISGITKDVTQRMNTIVWALNAENNTLQNLVEYIREYGSSFFEHSPIVFRNDLPEKNGDVQLSGLQRKNIFLCVKEALNNIYKHSGAQNAWIVIHITGHLLTIAVHDDGKGVYGTNPFGNGLKNIKKRMQEINGEVSFATGNDNAGGMVVLMKVPLILSAVLAGSGNATFTDAR